MRKSRIQKVSQNCKITGSLWAIKGVICQIKFWENSPPATLVSWWNSYQSRANQYPVMDILSSIKNSIGKLYLTIYFSVSPASVNRPPLSKIMQVSPLSTEHNCFSQPTAFKAAILNWIVEQLQLWKYQKWMLIIILSFHVYLHYIL